MLAVTSVNLPQKLRYALITKIQFHPFFLIITGIKDNISRKGNILVIQLITRLI